MAEWNKMYENFIHLFTFGYIFFHLYSAIFPSHHYIFQIICGKVFNTWMKIFWAKKEGHAPPSPSQNPPMMMSVGSVRDDGRLWMWWTCGECTSRQYNVSITTFIISRTFLVFLSYRQFVHTDRMYGVSVLQVVGGTNCVQLFPSKVSDLPSAVSTPSGLWFPNHHIGHCSETWLQFCK